MQRSQAIERLMLGLLFGSGSKCPWRIAGVFPATAINFATEQPFPAANALQLEVVAIEKDYKSAFWATQEQWQAMGGRVRQGEIGTMINHLDTGSAVIVFNLDQVDGLLLDKHRPVPLSWDEIAVERLIAATGVTIVHRGKVGYYHYGKKLVAIPLPEHFRYQADYYATLLHELSHWAIEHLGLLDTYETDELVAEMSAYLVCAEMDIPARTGRCLTYLRDWLDFMTWCERQFFQSLSRASRVTDFLINRYVKDRLHQAMLKRRFNRGTP